MNNTHIGAQVPSYVVNSGTLYDNTSQDPFNTSQPCNVLEHNGLASM